MAQEGNIFADLMRADAKGIHMSTYLYQTGDYTNEETDHRASADEEDGAENAIADDDNAQRSGGGGGGGGGQTMASVFAREFMSSAGKVARAIVSVPASVRHNVEYMAASNELALRERREAAAKAKQRSTYDVRKLRSGVAGAPSVAPIGTKGLSLAQYRTRHESRFPSLATRFQSAVVWTQREVHPDPLGTDPAVVSSFLVAALAALTFSDVVYALSLAIVGALCVVLFFAFMRVWLPVSTRDIASVESVALALSAEAVAVVAGFSLFRYISTIEALGVAPLWAALRHACSQYVPQHMHIADTFVDCTPWQLYVLVVALYVVVFMSQFDKLYAGCLVSTVLLAAAPALLRMPGAVAIMQPASGGVNAYTLDVAAGADPDMAPVVRTYVFACVACAVTLLLAPFAIKHAYGFNVALAAALFFSVASFYAWIY